MGLRNLFDLIHNELRWPIIIVLGILLFVNASGKFNIDAVLDKTPEENINQFLTQVENINPKKTMNEELTGVPLYDENRILYYMLYEMGDRDYYVFVFTKDTAIDYEMIQAVNQYKELGGDIPLYGMNVTELKGTPDEMLMEKAPFVLKLSRQNIEGFEKPVAIKSGIYDSVELVNELMLKTIEPSNKEQGKKEEAKSETKTEAKDEEKTLLDNIFGEEGIFGKLFKDGELR